MIIMEQKYQDMLDEVKAHVFSNILDHQQAREQERESGIIHQSHCFSQKPPWE